MYPWWWLNHFHLCRWINHQVVDSLREGALGYVCVCLCTDTDEGRPSNPGRAWNSLDPDTWSVLCWNARLDSRLISQHKNMWKKTGWPWMNGEMNDHQSWWRPAGSEDTQTDSFRTLFLTCAEQDWNQVCGLSAIRINEVHKGTSSASFILYKYNET